MEYRNITIDEINCLIDNHCRCDDWGRVEVLDGFNPRYVRNVNFSGDIKIGKFEGTQLTIGGIERYTGIYNATIHNCTIGSNVYINQVRSYLVNYNIEDEVIIDDVDIISVEGETTFGNGIEVSVLCETGGREVKICDHLSAQMAYIYAMYRDRKNTIKILDKIVSDYTQSVKSTRGVIGARAKITGTRIIKNAKIGDCAEVMCASRLYNVTVNSKQEAPTYIGTGVIIDNSIISTNCVIYDSAFIYSCFVGQGCEIGKQFSAEQSLFFANCIGLHGEACSIFAGPFTVTHHKNTLLIAGMYSFMNAGSGTNYSNHMYKLGPIHQGIIERGSKTASDSYVKWPAKVGPFTVVMGRHYHNSDTSDFPFSYLIEKDDESFLVPGVNVRSVGTIRDAQKWPKRDKRTDTEKLDCINYNLLSPFIIHRIFNGVNALKSLRSLCGITSNYYAYSSTRIKATSLEKGLSFYDMVIYKFLGNSLISRLENRDCSSDEAMVNSLKPDTEIGKGDWLDICGLIAPKSEVRNILQNIDSGALSTIDSINKAFVELHVNYYTYEWTWALAKIECVMKKPYTEMTRQDAIALVEKWKKSVVDLDNLILQDARKEFTESVKISFGADGDDKDKDKDFSGVRGDFESNNFVMSVKQHIEIKSKLGDKMLGILGKE